jgi:ankyrin repeat protein
MEVKINQLKLSLFTGKMDVLDILQCPEIGINDVDECGETALHIAVYKRSVFLTDIMGYKGIKLDVPNVWNETALWMACDYDNVFAVGQLIRSDPRPDIHIKDMYNCTLLGLACSKSPDCAKELLTLTDIDVNEADDFGTTPLMLACKQTDFQLVELLLRRCDVWAEDHFGRTCRDTGCVLMYRRLIDKARFRDLVLVLCTASGNIGRLPFAILNGVLSLM